MFACRQTPKNRIAPLETNPAIAETARAVVVPPVTRTLLPYELFQFLLGSHVCSHIKSSAPIFNLTPSETRYILFVPLRTLADR
jgi:hypothetical protein